jgi:hypothetical protein
MSQKSSLPQAAKSVSQVLMSDSAAGTNTVALVTLERWFGGRQYRPTCALAKGPKGTVSELRLQAVVGAWHIHRTIEVRS